MDDLLIIHLTKIQVVLPYRVKRMWSFKDHAVIDSTGNFPHSFRRGNREGSHQAANTSSSQRFHRREKGCPSSNTVIHYQNGSAF